MHYYYPIQEQIDYDYFARSIDDDYYENYKDEETEYSQYFMD